MKRRGKHAAPSTAAVIAAQAAPAIAIAGIAVTGHTGPLPMVHDTGSFPKVEDTGSFHAVTEDAAAPATDLVAHSVTVRSVSVTAKHAKPVTYTVQAGDTLSGIAKTTMGHAGAWPSLFKANQKIVSNPNMIFPGEHLGIPADNPKTDVSYRPSYAPSYTPKHSSSDNGDSKPVVHVDAVSAPSSTGLSGTLSRTGLESLWESAGGPSWAASEAATVAECESGGNQYAHNPSGASGYWQILGEVVGGDVYNPQVNAENAVAKFKASGDTFAQWVCQP